MAQFYIKSRNVPSGKVGPYTTAQIKSLIKNKKLKPDNNRVIRPDDGDDDAWLTVKDWQRQFAGGTSDNGTDRNGTRATPDGIPPIGEFLNALDADPSEQASPGQPNRPQEPVPAATQTAPPAPVQHAIAQPAPSAGTSTASILALVLGSIFLVGITAVVSGGIVYYLVNNDDAQERLKKEIEALEDQVDELEGDVTQKEAERDSVKAELKKLNSEKDATAKEKQKLETEIERLTSRLEQFRRWQVAEIVVVDPPKLATAFVEDSGKYRMVARIDGDDTMPSISVARRNAAKFVPVDRALAGMLHTRLEIDELTDGPQTERIRSFFENADFWPDTVTPGSEFVTFVDIVGNRPQIGFYEAATPDALRIVSLQGERQEIPKSRIMPGTAVKGSLTELTWAIDEQQFIDSTLMRCALLLQSGAFENSPHAVALHCYVDPPERLYSQLIADDHSALPEVAPESPIFLHFLRDSAAIAGWLADQQERDRHKRELERLEDYTHQFANEISSKLSSLGVMLIQPQSLTEILGTQGLSLDLFEEMRSEIALRACVTHAINVAVSFSDSKPPLPFLKISLTDINSGREILTRTSEIQDENFLDSLRSGYRDYILNSGRHAMLELRKDVAEREAKGEFKDLDDFEPFEPIESPELIKDGRRGERRLNDPSLVILESGINDREVDYRPLFARHLSSRRRGDFVLATEKDDGGVKYVDNADEAPEFDRFRYLVHQVTSAVLPPAGRVSRVNGDEVEISMGFRSVVSQGDKFRILRYFEGSDVRDVGNLSGSEYERLMPIRIDVQDAQIPKVFGTRLSTGFENVWPNDYVVRVGDIVIPARRTTEITFVERPVYLEAEPNSPIGRAMRNDADYNRPKEPEVRARSLKFAQRVQNRLTDALTKMRVRMKVATSDAESAIRVRRDTDVEPILAEQVKVAKSQGASYVIVASVQPYDTSRHMLHIYVKDAENEPIFSENVELAELWVQ